MTALFFLLSLTAPVSASGSLPLRVLHTPVISAQAGKPLQLHAKVQGDWNFQRLELKVRRPNQAYESYPFARSKRSWYRADLPAQKLQGPQLQYYISSLGRDGQRRAHFGSEERPQSIDIRGRSTADDMESQLRRYNGKRSTLSVGGRFALFGERREGRWNELNQREELRTENFSDRYWEFDLEYKYRPLSFLHDIRIGMNVMRGEWPEVDGEALYDEETPGVNYGYGELNIEMHRWFSVGARLILGASAEGFVSGLAGILRVGDMTGVHFALEQEGISDLGSRTDMRFHWNTVPRFPMALGIELSDWPAEKTEAANLSFDLGWELNEAWLLQVRMGSANRRESFTRGWLGGLRLGHNF